MACACAQEPPGVEVRQVLVANRDLPRAPPCSLLVGVQIPFLATSL